MRRRARRDHRRRLRCRRDRRPAGRVRAAQRAAMRLLHARHAAHRAGTAEATARCRAASRSASIFPATTAAAPAIRPSSTRSKRWRRRAREANDENRRRLSLHSHRARPAEFLHRPLGAAAESGPPHARPRAIRQRRDAAAHGACRLRALAARPCRDQENRFDGRQEGARRHRHRHRRGTRQDNHALGRRAHAPQGHQVGAAVSARGRARLLAGRGGRRRGRAHPRRGRGRLRAGRGRIRGAAARHRPGDRARSEDAGHPSRARRQSLLRARAHRRRSRQGLHRRRRRGRDHLRVRPPHRRVQRAARHRRRLESGRAAADRLSRARRRRT